MLFGVFILLTSKTRAGEPVSKSTTIIQVSLAIFSPPLAFYEKTDVCIPQRFPLQHTLLLSLPAESALAVHAVIRSGSLTPRKGINPELDHRTTMDMERCPRQRP